MSENARIGRDRKDNEMRKTLGVMVSLLFAGAAGAAFAAPPAVDANCALFGECKTDEAVVDEPETVVDEAPAATSGPKVRRSATRGFSMTGPSTPATTAPKTTKPATATATTSRKPVAKPVTKVASVRPKNVQAMQAAEAIRAAQLITFRSGSAELTPDGTAIARQIANAMMRPDKASMRFSLEGHTDAVGTRALNIGLSERRANALAAYLVSQGVAPARLSTVGYGFDKPLPGLPGTSPANRRVEVRPGN
jgi:OmpA-OmpF porin, OOP family